MFLSCAAVTVAVALGVRQSLGIFLIPIESTLQLSRQSLSLAIALQNLVWGITQPGAGYLADRFGCRRVLIAGSILYIGGLTIAAISTSALGLQIGIGIFTGLGLSGTTFSVVLGAVSRAVPRGQRGAAVGAVTAGGSMGMFLVVPGCQWLLAHAPWNVTLLLLSSSLVAILVVAGYFDTATRSATDNSSPEADISFRTMLRQAAAHRGFLLLTTGFLVCGFHVAFIATHLPAYVSASSLPPATGAFALALIGLVNILGTYAFGTWGDRFRKKYLLCALYFGRALVISGFLIFPLTQGSALVFASAIGFLWLGTVPLTNGLLAEIFGLRHLGALFGIVFLSHQIGSFLGAWWGGVVFDQTGSYDAVWLTSVGLAVLAAALHWPIDDSRYVISPRVASATV